LNGRAVRFAIILSSFVNSAALIFVQLVFFVGSILRQKNYQWWFTAANLGAHSNEVSPPAENKAMLGCIATAVAKPTTL
jgi:hypothetical protein